MINTEFLLTSLVVVLLPGTGVIYTVSTGLFLGGRASVAAAAGCTAGIVPHLVASILGLSAILHLSAVAFQLIKFAGALYLLYLAWTMWRDTGALSFNSAPAKNNILVIFRRGILINILNPKLTIFFLAFLPLFVQPEAAASPMLQLVGLSLIFMAMTLVVFVVYGLWANAVRHYVIDSPRVIVGLRRTFGAVFAVLGIKLALTEQ